MGITRSRLLGVCEVSLFPYVGNGMAVVFDARRFLINEVTNRDDIGDAARRHHKPCLPGLGGY